MPNFSCPECGKTFKGGQGLASHRRSAHGIKGKHITEKRKYSKRKLSLNGAVRFCPGCGMNLSVVEAAMKLMSK